MKSIIAAALWILAAVFSVYAATTQEPKPIPIPGGEYIVSGDSMIVSLDYPLANNRDTIVGNYVQGPQGLRLNMDQEKDLLDFAKALREQLMGLKTVTGMGALRSVIVHYNQLTITRYPRVEWGLVLSPLEAQLTAIAKEKGLPEAEK